MPSNATGLARSRPAARARTAPRRRCAHTSCASVGLEADERAPRSSDHAAGHRGVAGLHLDPVRARGFDAARDHEQRRHAVPQVRRAEGEQERARRPAQRRGGAACRRSVGRSTACRCSMARHFSIGLLDQSPTSAGRVRIRRGRRAPAPHSMALRIAASSDGSCSSRYSATCSSLTRRRSGRTRNAADQRARRRRSGDAERDDRGRD